MTFSNYSKDNEISGINLKYLDTKNNCTDLDWFVAYHLTKLTLPR